MKTLDGLTDLQMVVLSWLTFHPGHSPEDIAKGLRAEDDSDEIATCCADLAAAGCVEHMTLH